MSGSPFLSPVITFDTPEDRCVRQWEKNDKPHKGLWHAGGGGGEGGKADSWVFSLSQIYLFLFDVWECLLRACMDTTHMSGDHRGQ